MDVGSLPILAWSFVSGLATVGTLLFSRISIERAETEKNDRHLKMAFAASILIFLSFLINIWWRIYVRFGISHLIGTVIVSVVPLVIVLFFLRYRNRLVFIIPICFLAFLYFLLSAIIAYQLIRN
jgi:glucan phosphoethanolaminetransferase (alkaline phosphatase superfamily)